MKRTLTVLISILVGIFIILSLLGDKDYPAEKDLYKINRKFSHIKDDPLSTPEARYKEVIEDYKKFIKKYPDSKLTPFAQILIGRTYFVKKDYEMARETFERVVQQYAKDKPGVAAQGLIEIAGTYAQQKNVDGIMKTYDRMKRDFPLTRQGLAAPTMIAEILTASSLPGAAQAYDSAIKYYRQLALAQGKSKISFQAINYIAGCQAALGHWEQAINAYAEILLAYTEPDYMDDKSIMFLLKAINTFSVVKLGNFDLPVNIYNKFMATYPKHPLNPYLKQMIEGMHQLKEQQAKQQTEQQATAPAAK